ncbi:MAG TPA: hypothetical protein VFK13_07055 [Gemmatimonadaceae bacterium]|nr:hypothetical protein [Gemmatimonadaceae bacterium]
MTKALRALEGLSLVERRMVPHRRHPGVRVAHYRLAAALFPRGAEPWTKVPADLVYSRSWPSDFTGTRFRDARLAHLDGAAARHTWLALMAIGPIHDGTAYVEECVSTRLDACVQEALDEFEAEHFPNGVPPVVSAETQERFMAEWDALEWVDFAMLNARDGARAAIEARALAAVPSMKALARLTGLRPSAFVARPSLYHLVNRCSPGDTGGFTR